MLIALAGPNGAGKSTFYEAQLADAAFPFVNAAVLALTGGLNGYEAAKMADQLRLFAERRSFLFETVFSDPVGEKLEFLKHAEAESYAALSIFVGISVPWLSDTRVAIRVSQGGHDVLADSELGDAYRLVATREDGGAVVLHGAAPEWLLPKP